MRANAPQPRVRHPFMPTRVFSQGIPDFSIPPPLLPGAQAMYSSFPTAYSTMPPPPSISAQNTKITIFKRFFDFFGKKSQLLTPVALKCSITLVLKVDMERISESDYADTVLFFLFRSYHNENFIHLGLNNNQPYNYVRPPQASPVVQFGQQQASTYHHPPQQPVVSPVTSTTISYLQASPPPVVASPTRPSVNAANFNRYGLTSGRKCDFDASIQSSPPASSISPSTSLSPKNKIKRNSVSLSRLPRLYIYHLINLSSSVSPPVSKVAKTASTDKEANNTSTASVTDDEESENASATNITPTNQNSLSNNNRIFVDGRPYEVRFVQDKAVIERNGLPHQVTFIGKAKDVVIDGVPHKMNFGDEGLQITLDGRSLSIRFGAPSRELYIGSMPLRGSFGGPPIHFALNGVKHRAQLCGPPPEVKIDAEPSYELLRFLRPLANASSSTMATQSSGSGNYGYSSYTAPRPAPMPQVFARPQAAPNVARVATPMAIDQRLLMSVLKTLPPRPQGIDLVEQRPCPLSTLTDFNLNLLRIRYKSVINALYFDKSLQCDTCAERFNDEESYIRHLGYHSQIEPLSIGRTKTWFSLAQDWVEFQTEQESIEQVVKTEIDADENGIEDEDDKEKIQAGILLDEQYQNTYCAVCGDKFEQIWDEEDESWKFSNAVTVNDKVYHTFCRGEEQDSPPREDDDSQDLYFCLFESHTNEGRNRPKPSSSSDMRIKSEPDQGDYDVFSTTQAAAQPSNACAAAANANRNIDGARFDK
uniref:C2H2-type domain-containing protein n=1 Tax=Romanomermis culicivorax TaxID=13658 RepID=A0A915HFP8_ROMCU